MIKIALTGPIASGKSFVEDILAQQGAITVDTDKLVHNLLKNDKNIIQKVYELFITEKIDVRTQTGSIDRKKVGAIVFSDKQKLKKLESIILPEIKKITQDFFKNHEKSKNQKIIAVSAPMLFEAKMEDMFDFIVMLTSDENIRIQRLMQTRGLSKEDALARIKSQKFGEEKLKKSDFIIENNGSPEDLKKQVITILKNIQK